MNSDFGSRMRQVFAGNGSPAGQTQARFVELAQQAPPEALREGIAAMFRAASAPAFGQIAARLFEQADAERQAGMLNHLLDGMGPDLVSSLVAGAGGTGLAWLVAQLTQGGAAVTPAQAERLTAEQMRQLASHAEGHQPGAVGAMCHFLARHPGLMAALDPRSLGIVLAHMAPAPPA